MFWLRRRLGCAGLPWLHIRERMKRCLPEGPGGVEELGFSSHELRTFSDTHQLAEIAERFVCRGDTKRLEKIAWWGSALGDIASVGLPGERSKILWEAAAFNLGVSLFDSVVEEEPDSAATLSQALGLAHLEERLERSSASGTPLVCEDRSLGLVVRLFDSALAGAGRRFSSWPGHREFLGDLLGRMYRSELGLSEDRFAAKSLPTVFIGALGHHSDEERAHCFFRVLANFFQLWDDWLDLTEDFGGLAPNSFLGAPQAPVSLRGVGYSLRFLLRAVGGSMFHESAASTLCNALMDSLCAAEQWDSTAHRKTILLYRELLG
jgi:hypothetical protein